MAGYAELQERLAALRKNKTELIHWLREALRVRQLTPTLVEVFPVFEDYREDPDIINVLSEFGKRSRGNGHTPSDS